MSVFYDDLVWHEGRVTDRGEQRNNDITLIFYSSLQCYTGELPASAFLARQLCYVTLETWTKMMHCRGGEGLNQADVNDVIYPRNSRFRLRRGQLPVSSHRPRRPLASLRDWSWRVVVRRRWWTCTTMTSSHYIDPAPSNRHCITAAGDVNATAEW